MIKMNEQSLFELGASIRQDETMVRLDFSNPEHRAYILGELGGSEHLQQTFPGLYAQFTQAVLRDTQRGGVRVGEPDAFQDAADIFYGFYNKQSGTMVFKGVTSIKEEARYICQRVHIYQNNGVLLLATGSVTPHCRHAVLSLNEPISLSEPQANSTLVFDFFSLWYEETDGLQAAYYNLEDSLSWNAVDYVEQVTVLDPVHKKTSADSPIVVCYNRSSQTGEQVDYDSYDEAMDPVTHRQKLYLDVGAEVTLAAEALPFSAVDVSKLLLKLDCQSGIASYQKKDRVQKILNAFQPTEKGFVFHLDKDWQDVVPAARLPMREPVDLLLRVEFQAANYQKRGRITVQSAAVPYPPAPSVVTISQLNFLWGCIADNTPVLLKDGTVRQAGQIRIGDQLAMESGAGTVADVIVGREQSPLWCICTANGRKLCCTGLHPVLTRRGFVVAEQLVGSDEVMDKTDGFVRISALYPQSHEAVVNFVIRPEDPAAPYATMVCDQLVVGDYAMQCQCTKASCRTDEKTEISEELQQLMNHFGSEKR